MINSGSLQKCLHCGQEGNQQFCGHCGHAYQVKRITLPGLLHDVFHFFTHLDKGFGYTAKQLVIAPGSMQKQYILGDRSRHQKPFSMFFICATVAALSRYWIFTVLLKYYNSGNEQEADFFHHYLVIVQIALVPFTALITYLLFIKSGYNYAEIGVFTLYTVSVFFLIVSCITLVKLIWPHLDTAFIEFPILLIYSLVTFIRFFEKTPAWLAGLKSLVIIVVVFMITQYIEDGVINYLSHHSLQRH